MTTSKYETKYEQQGGILLILGGYMVVEYLSGLKAALDIAKTLKTATDSIDDAEIKLQIAELISKLADAKMEAAENAEKITELERIIQTRDSLAFGGEKYYLKTDGENDDGPFCPTCYDSESKLIRMQHVLGGTFGEWNCRVCKGSFGTKSTRPHRYRPKGEW